MRNQFLSLSRYYVVHKIRWIQKFHKDYIFLNNLFYKTIKRLLIDKIAQKSFCCAFYNMILSMYLQIAFPCVHQPVDDQPYQQMLWVFWKKIVFRLFSIKYNESCNKCVKSRYYSLLIIFAGFPRILNFWGICCREFTSPWIIFRRLNLFLTLEPFVFAFPPLTDHEKKKIQGCGM